MNDELIVACPTPKLMQKRLASGAYQHGEEGLEKRCSKCREYWPADSEFFYASRGEPDGLIHTCKACYQENRYPSGRRTLNQEKGKPMNNGKNIAAAVSATSSKDWMVRIEAALAAGQKPAYDDIEEGLHFLLSENATLKSFASETSQVIGRMCIARREGNDEKALGALDSFVLARVIIKEAPVTH